MNFITKYKEKKQLREYTLARDKMFKEYERAVWNDTVASTWDDLTNQKIRALDPKIQLLATILINRAERELGIHLKITHGFRSFSEQNALYAQSRTQAMLDTVGLKNVVAKPNLPKVTNAYGGRSMHNYGLAFDIALDTKDSSKLYDINWGAVSKIGKDLGLTWGGDWEGIVDRPHFELNN